MADATRGPHAIAATGKASKFGQADGRKIYPPPTMAKAPVFARETDLRNIPGSKRAVKKLLTTSRVAVRGYEE